jgi:hypothetical protein
MKNSVCRPSLIAAPVVSSPTTIGGVAPGDGEQAQREAERHVTGRAQRNRLVEPDGVAGNDRAVQDVEDWIGVEHRERRARGEDRERVAFPQGQQPSDRVDVAAGQHHGRYGRGTQAGARVQRWRALDLRP